ncbi:T7SS effector LXG polymorphic toxin [Lentibacillus sp. CBA3610]|uniref:T7SS effector LXG polymorphic toxin n=1 Tax=Lentibacillus sp. CBA3610 TaxID=2518176 RepID=UPI001595DE26|nr:T7SS effector LXG polymorphic toxin [Lentibacillus sp. CBA3610]QKY69799.1 hypothetical protein Len3610_09510 [Lentibacillus sp. CBA3610]
MGQKVDISEVIEFSDELKTASEDIKSNLKSVEESIESISSMSSFSGKTANEAKAYFEDFHKTVLTSFNGLFTDLYDHLKKHVQSFQSRVDSSESAIIESDYLNETERDIIDDYDRLSEEQDGVREILSSVSDISSANQPFSFTLDADKDDAVKTVTELEGELASFTSEGKGLISQTEDLLHQIEVTLNNAGAVKGDARFTDYKGNSTTVGLAALKDYNTEKREAMIAEAKEAKDKVIKDMNEPSQEILNKAYTQLKNGKIDETEYYNHLAELKKLQNETDQDKEVSENFINYVMDNFDGITDTFEGNAIAGVIKQSMEDYGNDSLRRADLVKAMNANNPSPTSNYLKDMGNKFNNGGKAISGSLTALTIGVGTYIDYKNTDKTVGEAFTKNAASGGAGFIASAATAKIIMGGALVSNPVGWAVAGGVVVGTGVTWTFNWAYDNNFLGIQDGVDWAGQQLDKAGQQISKGWDWATEKVSDGLDWAGEATSSGLIS